MPTTRVRSSGSVQPSSATHLVYETVPPATTPNTIVVDTTQWPLPGHVTDVMTDVVTPGFTSLQRSGSIVNNPMHRISESYTRGSGSIDWIRTPPSPLVTWQNYHLSGNLTAYWEGRGRFSHIKTGLTPNLDEANLSKLAAIKARNNINPILVQSLVSAVELPKTLALVSQTVNSIRGLRRAVVNGKLEDAIRILGSQRSKRIKVTSIAFSKQSLSQRWLELRYGWTPLVFEVQGAIKALTKPAELKPRRATARGFASGKSEQHSDQTWVSNSGLGDLTLRTTLQEVLEIRAYCLYIADLKYQRARDFGVAEVPLAIWELVPFSFVVDWFVNIGDWIEALTPRLGITILAEGFTSKRIETYKRQFQSWTSVPSGSSEWTLTGSWSATPDVLLRTEKKRTPNLDVLFSYPPVSIKLDKKRVIDSIALLSRLV